MRRLLGLLLLAAACQTKSADDILAEAVKSAPWMIQVLESCEGHKSAKRDIDKNTIHRDTMNIITKSDVKEARGEVETLLPGKTPDEYVLQLKTGDMRFSSESKERPIKRGSPLFDQVAKLEKGQCVVFSATRLAPSVFGQQAQLCMLRFYAEFTQLEPCP